VEVGAGAAYLQPGDWVIPGASGWGTWRTHAVCSGETINKIPNSLPLLTAATMSVNACTAYRLLKDFESLSAGDYVIQNGANSGVGQAVIQIAKSMSLKTINIVRNRPNIEELTKTLTSLGATHVVTDEFLKSSDGVALLKSLSGRPKLALNCVGGKASIDLMKSLADRGSMVTYGGMSKMPLVVPTGPLIFSDIQLKGFWMTRWNREYRGTMLMSEMWDYLVDLVKNEKLKAPLHRTVDFAQFPDGVAKSMESFTSEKQILLF